MTDSASPQFDYLIIGAGAAGCVLANRLSARQDCKVLLLEAGDDLTPGREPADIRSVFPLAAFNARYMWPDTRVHWRQVDNSPALSLPQGKILGGSSTVHGMWALRGLPEDYDEWERLGAAGWGWKGVLPIFRRLETDQDFNGSSHGHDGPVPIRREPPTAWSPLAHAVRAAATHRGFPHIEDANADFRDGHCTLPNSRFERSRASGSCCYLDARVRRRSNLRILCNHTVRRLAFEGSRAVGAEVTKADGSAVIFRAREVILTAGALRTPVLLMRSGIGPAEHLRAAAIAVAVERPGVGQNLQNHAVVYAVALLKKGARETDWTIKPAASTYLRWSSGEAGCSAGDLGMYVRSYLSWHALGRRTASLAPVLLKPASRGCISLDSSNPLSEPRIEFNFLKDSRDLPRLMTAVRLAAELFNSDELKSVCGPGSALRNVAAVMRFNTRSVRNAVSVGMAAALIDLVPSFGSSLLAALGEMQPVSEVAANADALAEFITESITGTGHVCGTCRMGKQEDALAVVDPAGRVYGCEGLRVADASVMPNVPSGNTYIPTVMVAEKIAQAITGSSLSQAQFATHNPRFDGWTAAHCCDDGEGV